MTKVGIVKDLDISERPGGAQRAMQLFEAAAPYGYELTRLRPGSVAGSDCDLYVSGNVKTFGDVDLNWLAEHADRHVRYQFDLWDDAPNATRWARELADKAAAVLYPSPLYRELFSRRFGVQQHEGLRGICLPPPLDLEAFRPHREKYDRQGRSGYCYFGEVHPLKGVDIAIRWLHGQFMDEDYDEQPVLDVYGPMSYQFPASNWWRYQGCPPQEQLWDAVASHEWMIFMPRKADGFSSSLLEAMCLGLKVHANGRLGIESWLPYCERGGFEELIEKCALAPGAFWEIAAEAASGRIGA